MAIKVIKWISIPALLIASIFSGLADHYELLVDLVICLGAVVCVRRAVQMEEYYWAAGFVTVVVVFSPLLLVAKVFLLMALACAAMFATVAAAFRVKPLPAQ